MKYLMLIASLLTISAPSVALAQSVKEIIHEFVFSYSAAATTYRMCQDAPWSREHDEASTRIVEGQMADLGINSSESERVVKQYLDEENGADLYHYYKAKGIKRFLEIPKSQIEAGYIYNNASPDRTYNESLGTYEYPPVQEFCDLAEREMKAGSAIGKYFTDKK